MSYGELSQALRDCIQPFVDGVIVHDLGAGNLVLSEELVRLGAREVVAVDKELPGRSVPKVRFEHTTFDKFYEPIHTAFLSWPVNYPVPGLLRLVASAQIVIYLGSNTDGSACGTQDLFRNFLRRNVLMYHPSRRNSLLILGTYVMGYRQATAEEFAALNQDRVYAFGEANLAASKYIPDSEWEFTF